MIMHARTPQAHTMIEGPLMEDKKNVASAGTTQQVTVNRFTTYAIKVIIKVISK